MKGRWIIYSDEEMAWLEANRLLPIADYASAFCATFNRSDVTAQQLHGLRKRKGWKTGRTGCFEKGAVSWNKGKPMPAHPNSALHHFRPGERSGVAVRLYKPIGSERVSKDGYRERKINDDMPLQARWRAVHLIEWEAANGPLPKGMCLKCLDGEKGNTNPSNWALIERALLPRLAGRWSTPFDEAAQELKPAILATAKLQHRIRTVNKGRKVEA